eukprot:324793_1
MKFMYILAFTMSASASGYNMRGMQAVEKDVNGVVTAQDGSRSFPQRSLEAMVEEPKEEEVDDPIEEDSIISEEEIQDLLDKVSGDAYSRIADLYYQLTEQIDAALVDVDPNLDGANLVDARVAFVDELLLEDLFGGYEEYNGVDYDEDNYYGEDEEEYNNEDNGNKEDGEEDNLEFDGGYDDGFYYDDDQE